MDSSQIEWKAANIEHQLKQIGRKVYDEQLQRWTLEEQFQHFTLRNSDYSQLMGRYNLLPKYQFEIDEFKSTLDRYLINEFDKHNHRRLVHFNNGLYENGKWQCISLFQFIPIEDFDKEFRMMVYQRSADTSKLLDDWRFFSEIAYLFYQTFHRQISVINIMYGSLHTTYVESSRS